MTEKIYSMEYKNGNNYYSIQIIATFEAAETHAENLGLSAPELVVANIPLLDEGFH